MVTVDRAGERSIHPLPSEVVSSIAAGEVIDSVAAAVRELVENALDAGATRISISLFPELWRLQVADNGRGMASEDLRYCATAHSTSKIHSLDDLYQIASLGFRGEALHSLARVSGLEIASRLPLAEGSAGWRATYNSQGEPEILETAALAPGTIVTASNLFGCMPVRRQGLPSLSQQLKAVQTTVHQFALCHPSVTWQVWHDGRPWFKISPGKTARHLLPQLLKTVRSSDLQGLELALETPQASPGQLQLVVGLPDRCHRRQPDWVKVAVNGRVVRCLELERAILSAFSRTLPRDRFPVCFLHLKLGPGQIDWNRHPTKAEIYLHSLPFWQEQVVRGIERALRLSQATLPSGLQDRRIGQLLKASEAKGSYRAAPSPGGEAPDPSAAFPSIELRAVAQVNRTYIVAEHPHGLWLVEQHVAHERCLYEALQDDWQLVPLETPTLLTQLTAKQVEQLQRLGLEVELFGEQMWAVRNAPALLAEREDLEAALIELSWGGDLQAAQVATACRSAIRNGTPLSLPEMQALLDRWKQARHPRTCPHGRPIYLSLEESALARFFRRHWVIGKGQVRS